MLNLSSAVSKIWGRVPVTPLTSFYWLLNYYNTSGNNPEPTIQWDYNQSVVDSNDNVFSVGNVGGSEAKPLITKTAPDGSLVWSKSLVSPDGYFLYGNAVALDSLDNVYVTLVENDYDLSSNPILNTYLVKLDNVTGNILWQTKYNLNFSDPSLNYNDMSLNQIVVDSNNNIYVSFYFIGYTSVPQYQAGLLKFDSTGTLLWQRMFDEPPTYDPYVYNLGIGPDNNPVFTVEYQPPIGDRELTVVKMNSSGTVLWSKIIDTTYSTNIDPSQLCIDPFNNIYLTTIGADYVIKFDSAGNKLFEKTLENTTTSAHRSLKYYDGDFYLAARESNNFEPQILKISDTFNSILWQKGISFSDPNYQFNNGYYNYGESDLLKVKNASLYVTGYLRIDNFNTGSDIRTGFLLKVPADATLTGTYPLPSLGGTFTYSNLTSWTIYDSNNIIPTDSSRTFINSGGIQSTASLTITDYTAYNNPSGFGSTTPAPPGPVLQHVQPSISIQYGNNLSDVLTYPYGTRRHVWDMPNNQPVPGESTWALTQYEPWGDSAKTLQKFTSGDDYIYISYNKWPNCATSFQFASGIGSIYIKPTDPLHLTPKYISLPGYITGLGAKKQDGKWYVFAAMRGFATSGPNNTQQMYRGELDETGYPSWTLLNTITFSGPMVVSGGNPYENFYTSARYQYAPTNFNSSCTEAITRLVDSGIILSDNASMNGKTISNYAIKYTIAGLSVTSEIVQLEPLTLTNSFTQTFLGVSGTMNYYDKTVNVGLNGDYILAVDYVGDTKKYLKIVYNHNYVDNTVSSVGTDSPNQNDTIPYYTINFTRTVNTTLSAGFGSTVNHNKVMQITQTGQWYSPGSYTGPSTYSGASGTILVHFWDPTNEIILYTLTNSTLAFTNDQPTSGGTFNFQYCLNGTPQYTSGTRTNINWIDTVPKIYTVNDMSYYVSGIGKYHGVFRSPADNTSGATGTDPYSTNNLVISNDMIATINNDGITRSTILQAVGGSFINPSTNVLSLAWLTQRIAHK